LKLIYISVTVTEYIMRRPHCLNDCCFSLISIKKTHTNINEVDKLEQVTHYQKRDSKINMLSQ